MYAQAHLPINQDQPPLVVPSSALVFDSTGTRLWLLNDGKVYAQKVSVGRDFGTDVEITNGLKGDESVVTNPGVRLADGVEVQVPQQPPVAGQSPATQPMARQP